MSDKKSLAKKLSEVMGEVAYVQKDAVNSFQKYKYASAEAVLKKVNEALHSRGIAIGSAAELVNYHQGGPKEASVAVVKITLRFIDSETNEVIAIEGLGQGSDKGDKAVMKANTAALKYAMSNGFCISWGDDPEADVETDKAASTKPKKKVTKTTKVEKGFKTAFTREELENKIDSAEIELDLKNLRGMITTMRGTDHYGPLVKRYKAKMATIKEASNGRS